MKGRLSDVYLNNGGTGYDEFKKFIKFLYLLAKTGKMGLFAQDDMQTAVKLVSSNGCQPCRSKRDPNCKCEQQPDGCYKCRYAIVDASICRAQVFC
jgi:hypothetical protein